MNTLMKIAALGLEERLLREWSLRRALAVACAATLLTAFVLPTAPAEARQKKPANFLCTASDLQTDGAKKCIDKNYTKAGRDGIKHGSSYQVFCNANGTRQCCQVSDKSNETFSCEDILRVNTSGVATDPSDPGVERPPRVRKNYSIGPGILDSGPSLGTQGPTGTGAPLGGGKSAPQPAKIY